MVEKWGRPFQKRMQDRKLLSLEEEEGGDEGRTQFRVV